MKKAIQENKFKIEKFLDEYTFHTLREFAYDLGVKAPTRLVKKELINEISTKIMLLCAVDTIMGKGSLSNEDIKMIIAKINPIIYKKTSRKKQSN